MQNNLECPNCLGFLAELVVLLGIFGAIFLFALFPPSLMGF